KGRDHRDRPDRDQASPGGCGEVGRLEARGARRHRVPRFHAEVGRGAIMRFLYWVLAVAALSAAVVGVNSLRPRLTPAERGRRLAERLGCFGCHGPGGIHGAANPGRSDRTVPTFGDDLMMYAKTRDDG